MERMYVQYLAIYKYENLPIPIHFFARVGSKIFQILIKP